MKDILKHAMSYQSVELNLDALIDGALVAIRNAKAAMSRAEGEVDRRDLHFDNSNDIHETIYRSNHHRAFYAMMMAEHAVEYAQAWANYFALVEAKNRNSVSIKKGDSNGNSE